MFGSRSGSGVLMKTDSVEKILLLFILLEVTLRCFYWTRVGTLGMTFMHFWQPRCSLMRLFIAFEWNRYYFCHHSVAGFCSRGWDLDSRVPSRGPAVILIIYTSHAELLNL